ncbi:MAG: enoyl-CoA hydratase [Acidimicrobiia bacterium]
MDHLEVSDHDGVRVLTIDRPGAKNAMNPPLRAALVEAFAAIDADDDIKAAILTGVDPVFSAGVDFKQVQRAEDGESVAAGSHDNPAAVLRRVRKPVIAAVNGACVSGALEVALSASFIVASEHARFADTHALLGVTPTWGLTALLPRAVGVRKAREMSVTGNFVAADEALRLGLVAHVVPHDELLPFTLGLAQRIPANEAVREMLELYRRGDDLSLSGAITSETSHGANRKVDLTAFTAAGSAAAARQREDKE